MTLRLVAAGAALSLCLSATAQAELSPTAPVAKPAPRVIESTGSYVAAAQPIAAPQPAATSNTAAPQPSAPVERAPTVAVKPAVSEQRPRIRTAKYSGGEGSTWKTGRNAYGFMGTYGGCRYSGHAGPNGYTLDRVCR